MSSLAARFSRQAEVRGSALSRRRVSKVGAGFSADAERDSITMRVLSAYCNVRPVGQIVTDVENEAAPKPLRLLLLT